MNTANKQLAIPQLEQTASILKAVAHPIRLSILQLLVNEGRMSVNSICEILQSEQSLTSHHLSNMKLKGVLESKREGQKVYYSLKMEKMRNLLECIENCMDH